MAAMDVFSSHRPRFKLQSKSGMRPTSACVSHYPALCLDKKHPAFIMQIMYTRMASIITSPWPLKTFFRVIMPQLTSKIYLTVVVVSRIMEFKNMVFLDARKSLWTFRQHLRHIMLVRQESYYCSFKCVCWTFSPGCSGLSKRMECGNFCLTPFESLCYDNCKVKRGCCLCAHGLVVLGSMPVCTYLCLFIISAPCSCSMIETKHSVFHVFLVL